MNRSVRTLVLGIGNPLRGDDGAGRVVARLLRGRVGDQVRVAEHGGEATSLLAHIEGAAVAYLIDACVSGAPAGTVRRFDAGTMSLPPMGSDISTHGFGLAAALALGRVLGRLPARTIVFTIEGASFGSGEGLSAPVEAAAADVAGRVEAEIISSPPQDIEASGNRRAAAPS